MEGGATGDEQAEVGAGGEEGGDERRRGDDLLEAVEHEQRAAVAEGGLEGLEGRVVAGFADAERLGEGGGDEFGVGDRREGDEADAVGEAAGDRLGDLQGEAGLADAAGAGQGQEADPGLAEEAGDGRDLALAPDERGEGYRQAGRVGEVGVEDGHRELPGMGPRSRSPPSVAGS